MREAKPVAFTIEGATGSCASKVNGTYEPTDERQLGLPVYIKKGDSSLYVEAAKGPAPLRWYVRPKEKRGPDSNVCFGYSEIDENKLTVPHETQSKWTVNTVDGFKLQEGITCKRV